MQKMQCNLKEYVLCENNNLLCFFNDGTVRKINLQDLLEINDVEKIRSNDLVLKSGHIAAGGYCVTFNDSIDISANCLYKSGISIPLSLDDFLMFVKNNMVDSTESCAILECSRQNLAYLVSKKKLTPVKKDVKGNLYTKGNILNCRE